MRNCGCPHRDVRSAIERGACRRLACMRPYPLQVPAVEHHPTVGCPSTVMTGLKSIPRSPETDGSHRINVADECGDSKA